jgi:hypothetical protein
MSPRPPFEFGPVETETIYVELLEEDVEVYRPVDAVRESDGTYRLPASKDDPDEVWAFPPGSRVSCVPTKLYEGTFLVADRLAE